MEYLKNCDPQGLSPLVLAYMGDCVYELMVRSYAVDKGNRPVNKLNAMTRSLVNAGAQSDIYDIIKDSLTEEEEAIYKRGRNAKSNTRAKNQTIVDYRRATGIEALFGYLYIKRDYDRLSELFKLGVKGMENKNEKAKQQKK